MSSVQPAQFLPWVVMVWLVGALVFWVRLAGGWVVAARMRSMLVRRAPPEWQQTLSKLGARIGLSRPVQLLVSALVQVPTVVGWLRPVVLVPVGALGGLPAEHLEALLLHELAHIRRHDYLVNMLQSVAEALLFYHPAVWWVSGHIRAERELCCDDVAVSVRGDALTYARALAELESYRPAHLGAAIAANGGSLSDRIARLLGQSRPAAAPVWDRVCSRWRFCWWPRDTDCSASPKRVPLFKWRRSNEILLIGRRDRMGVARNPAAGWIARTHPCMLLIQFAYADHDPYAGPLAPLQASQVAGGPAWINSVGYDIEAKPESNTDPEADVADAGKRSWPTGSS